MLTENTHVPKCHMREEGVFIRLEPDGSSKIQCFQEKDISI